MNEEIISVRNSTVFDLGIDDVNVPRNAVTEFALRLWN